MNIRQRTATILTLLAMTPAVLAQGTYMGDAEVVRTPPPSQPAYGAAPQAQYGAPPQSGYGQPPSGYGQPNYPPPNYPAPPAGSGQPNYGQPNYGPPPGAYGQPGYALLSGDVPLAIWHGADNGSQIGVYYQIQETEAVRNVQLRAPEYLPVALESGIFLHPSRPEPEGRLRSIVYGRLVPQCCDDTASDTPSLYGIGTALV